MFDCEIEVIKPVKCKLLTAIRCNIITWLAIAACAVRKLPVYDNAQGLLAAVIYVRKIIT